MSLLTREGYIVSSDDFEPWHADELIVVAHKSPYHAEEPKPFAVFEDRGDGTVSVPRHWGEENYGRPVSAFGRVHMTKKMRFSGELRSSVQEDASKKSVEQLLTRGGGVLSARTGLGKTVVSLHVACSIGAKTLVVVHKQFLLDQWEERIHTFVPAARVGRLQRNVEDVEGCDIVVGMLQSISMREYDMDLFSDFGLIIFDEVHVVPPPVFSRALLRLCAPCMLGLSATPVRRDGLSRVIEWFIGPVFFQHDLADMEEVSVRVVEFNLGRKLPMNMTAATSILCGMQGRNDLIVEEIMKLYSAGHKILLLSDRRAHCETLLKAVRNAGGNGALYLGGMNAFELQRSSKQRVLFGTYSMAQDALDIPSLDALVLATPRSEVVQACGRILHGKTDLSPVIVDVVDQWFVGKAQFKKRQMYYKSAGFQLKF